jgi:hypothetical protein
MMVGIRPERRGVYGVMMRLIELVLFLRGVFTRCVNGELMTGSGISSSSVSYPDSSALEVSTIKGHPTS